MKKVAFRAAYVVALYALMEVCSFFALWAIGARIGDGGFSLAGLQADQKGRVENAPDLFGRGAFALHPYLGYVYDPDVHQDGSRGFTVGPYGFVDQTGPLPRRDKRRVIVGIFGGSVALRLAFEAAPVLVQELTSDPRFAGKEIVLVKVALGAFKQPQHLMALNYLLVLGAEFDIVVNMDGFNDVALDATYNRPKGVFPMFPNGWYFLTQDLAADPATRRLVGRIALFDSVRQSWAGGFSALSWLHSATLTLFWKAGDQYLANRLSDLRLTLQKGRSAEAPYVTRGPARRYGSEGEIYEDLALFWRNSSLQLDRLCRANGIAYFHFLQPNQYVPRSKELTPEERGLAYIQDHPYRVGAENGYPLLVREGRELIRQGVRFRDLSMIFRDRRETIYVDTCCHLNRLGYEIVAREMVRTIRQGLPPPHPEPRR